MAFALKVPPNASGPTGQERHILLAHGAIKTVGTFIIPTTDKQPWYRVISHGLSKDMPLSLLLCTLLVSGQKSLFLEFDRIYHTPSITGVNPFLFQQPRQLFEFYNKTSSTNKYNNEDVDDPKDRLRKHKRNNYCSNN